MFPECFLVFPFAYYFAMLGIRDIAERHNILGMIFVAVGCSFYQVAGISAAILLGTYLALQAEMQYSRSLFVKEMGFIIYIMLVPLVSFLILDLLVDIGIGEASNKNVVLFSLTADKMGPMLKDFFHGWWNMFRDNSGLLSIHWICAVLWLLGFSLTIISMIVQRNWSGILTSILLQLMYGILISVYPLASGTFFPRIIFPFYSGLQMTVVTGVFTGTGLFLHTRRISAFFVAALACFVFFQIATCHWIGIERYVSNNLDETYGKIILNQIEKEEKKNGSKVTKLAFCMDTDCCRFYSDLRWHVDQINERTAAVVPFSLLHKVAAEEGRSFEYAEMKDDVYQTYFSGKNWDCPDAEEQVVVIGDTAYGCVY